MTPVQDACRRIPPLFPLQDFVAVNPYLGLTWLPFDEAQQLIHKVTPGGGMVTVADSMDFENKTHWSAFVTDEISKWCSAYFDRGQCAWEFPWKHLPLYESWRQSAQLDANPEIFGLPHFRAHVSQLPHFSHAAIEQAVDRLRIPARETTDFLHREFMSIFGWSCYAAYQDRTSSIPLLPQLLAIRLAYDTALLALHPKWRFQSTPTTRVQMPALETGYREHLMARLRQPRVAAAPGRPDLQAVFCIDVRSEPYRRALEAQSTGIQTIGFAGFFGMPIAVNGTAHCPVLMQPSLQVEALAPKNGLFQQTRAAWDALRKSAVACFSTVEVLGALFGLGMLRQFDPPAPRQENAALGWTVTVDEQIELARAALQGMSLEPKDLAPVVLFCGHGSQSVNNPYSASLDCGACGGHRGDINARFAAALFNGKAVREALQIPPDTVFLAGLHNTTTQEATLYDAEQPMVQEWLNAATRQAANPDGLSRQRSRDWSEVRPEWGLAGNAAFLVAPRSRTRGVDLEGRVFLHDYEPANDPDGLVLTQILTAPVIVAAWINLQYYASTVNNNLFGSGNKALHNVVGAFGIWEGNGGDLRPGLPLQSLHDGTRWMHEPIRLQLFIEAPRERIKQILDANASIGELVRNEWLQVLASEDGSEWTAFQL